MNIQLFKLSIVVVFVVIIAALLIFVTLLGLVHP
jgi:hypothetical protein